MKKTLIALMALAGVACAADYTVTNVWSADFGTAYEGGYQVNGTLTSVGTVWDVVAVEGGTKTNGNKRVHMDGGVYGSWADDFQFSITLTLGNPISASNNYPVFAELSGNGSALRFGPYTSETDGNYVSIDGTLDSSTKVNDTTFAVEAGGKYTVTLTKIGTALTLAVDGREVSTGSFADAVSGNITSIALGGVSGSNNRINETVHSISYGTVTLVPEPATATLSLLALAGLAARRRRK